MHRESQETTILSVHVPPTLETFIKSRISSQGFHTVSEYIRALIRADQETAARQDTEVKLLEAIERGDYRKASPDFWKKLESAAKRKPAKRRIKRKPIS